MFLVPLSCLQCLVYLTWAQVSGARLRYQFEAASDARNLDRGHWPKAPFTLRAVTRVTAYALLSGDAHANHMQIVCKHANNMAKYVADVVVASATFFFLYDSDEENKASGFTTKRLQLRA